MWFKEGAEHVGRRTNRRKKTSGGQILEVDARATEKKQARVRWVSAVAALLVAIAGCVVAGMKGADWIRYELFASNPLYTMREPDIRTDGTLKPQAVRELCNLNAGGNLFAVSLAEVHKQLMMLPGVRSVEIRRQLPDTLIVRVGERSPVALLVTDKASLPVDREGYVLAPRAAVTRLPVIVGGTTPKLEPGMQVADAKILDALFALDVCDQQHICEVLRVQIKATDNENLELHLTSGEEVSLARADSAGHLRDLANTLKTFGERRQKLRFIDCSLKNSVPVQLALPPPQLVP